LGEGLPASAYHRLLLSSAHIITAISDEQDWHDLVFAHVLIVASLTAHR
jgi:hypothetical protein